MSYPSGYDAYKEYIATAEKKYEIPSGMLAALVQTESDFQVDPKDAGKGAKGIAQIVPKWHPGIDTSDPYASIDHAGLYLRQNYDEFGDWEKAQSAYNWGPTKTRDAINTYGDKWQEYLPLETKKYIANIRVRTEKFSQAGLPMSEVVAADVANTYNQALPTTSGIMTDPIEIYAANMPQISDSYATNKAQLDSIITGSTETYEDGYEQYKKGATTVQNEVLAAITEKYSAAFIDQGVLDPEVIKDLPQEEVLARVESEYKRLGDRDEEIRNLIGIDLMRRGLGNLPYTAIDDVWRDLDPRQTQFLLESYREQLTDQLQWDIDRVAAFQGEDWSIGAATWDIIKQDITPFWGAITRVLGTRKFLPEGVKMGVRGIFPGEIRQDIREWWAQATTEQKQEWLKGIEKEWTAIRQGPRHHMYTQYLVLENLMGIFTEDLLENGDPDDTFDRIMGNLDVGLGAVISIGVLAKRGKSIRGLFGSKKGNLSRQLATAGGAKSVADELDAAYTEVAHKYGVTIEEAAVNELPRPEPLAAERVVETDSIKHTSEPDQARIARAMEYTDEAETLLLSPADKANVIAKELDELNAKDTVHVHHKMSTFRPLENDVGADFRVVLGGGPNEGFTDIIGIMREMEDLGPNATWNIMRRNKDGVLEELVSADELATFKETGRIPSQLDEYLDMSQEGMEASRLFGMRRIQKVSTEDLAAALDNGWVPIDSPAWNAIRKELNDRALDPKSLAKARKQDALNLIDGEELFVEVQKRVYYTPKDATYDDSWMSFYDLPFIQSSFRLFGRLFAPNSKFTKLYERVHKSYRIEESLQMELNDIAAPFLTLGAKDKQVAGHMLEWIEDQAKSAQHATGYAAAPSMLDVAAQFPEASEKALRGVVAYREAADVAHKMFNRRLYRDFHRRGVVTARSVENSDAPNIHGLPMSRTSAGGTKLKAGTFYDPKTQKLVKLSDEEVDGIIAEGGGFLKMDFPMQNKRGQRYDQVLVRKGDYEIGKLSENPMHYYEGYTFRFYEDPIYILRVSKNPKVNGELTDKPIEEAIRTSATHAEAVRFLNRGKVKYFMDKEGLWRRLDGKGSGFKIVNSRDLNNTEGSLYQQQALYREGRMFWDQRSMDRLPDVDGNRAPVSDPTQALFKGLAMVSRQVSSEGLWKSFRHAFQEEYKDLPIFAGKKIKLEIDKLSSIEKDLREGLNASTGTLATRYKEALEMVRYLRSQMGTDAYLVPLLRSYIVKVANYVDASFTKPSGWVGKKRIALANGLQRWGLGMDPFAGMRKLAFSIYMVARPARQFLLQSMQVGFISPLAVKYVYSGKLFFDAWALRRGIAKLRATGFDDGWTDAAIAKRLGYTKAEYNRMVEEFHRSGLLGSVNTHDYSRGVKGLGAQLDPKAGALGRAAYSTKTGVRAGVNKLAAGFELGEQNNLTFSWLVALRRHMDKAGKGRSMKDLTRSEWDKIAIDADSLALAMTRPNKFKYQSGMFGVMFQFMSFQHRAALTLLGMNPAVKGTDVLKLWVGNYALWGANIGGAEDWTREFLNGAGLGHLADIEVLPGATLLDYLAAGMVETNFNLMGRAMFEEWQDLDISVLAPGVATFQIYETMLEIVAEKPVSVVWLGPSGNILDSVSTGLLIASGNAFNNEFQTPAEKLQQAAKVLTKYTFPQGNDFLTSWISYQNGQWFDKDGDKLHLEVAANSLAARSLFGIRPADEMSLYRMKSEKWKTEQEVDDYVNYFRPVMKELAVGWGNGTVTREDILEFVSVAHNLTEDAPEGIRHEILRRLMTVPDAEGQTVAGIIADLMKKGAPLGLVNTIEAQVKSMNIPPREKQMLLEVLSQLERATDNADQAQMDAVRKDLNKMKRN